MKKQTIIYGTMVIGALALIGKRTYELMKLKKTPEKEEIIEIEPRPEQE